MMEHWVQIDRIMTMAPVIPVMVIDDLDDAVPLSRALVSGGLPVLEITLRTDVAIAAIERIIGEVEGAIVGAGTVINPAQLDRVAALGCWFAVSPGFSDNLINASKDHACPLLPGAATATEVMHLLEYGFDRQKFFPAGPAGGTSYLNALASPLPQVKFCPTGGIGPDNAGTYLALSNVLCVGGSWVAPKDAVASRDFERITALARGAAALTTG